MKNENGFNITPKRRARGSGHLFKRGKNYYVTYKTNGNIKTVALKDKNNNPISDKKQAEARLEELRPTLLLDDQKELIKFVAENKNIGHDIFIQDVWNVFLKSSSRPDSGSVTLNGYKKHLSYFTNYLLSNFSTIQTISEINKSMVNDFFYWLWNDQRISGNYYNKILASLRLIFKHIGFVSLVNESLFNEIHRKIVERSQRKDFTFEQVIKIFKAFEDGFFYDTEVEELAEGRKRIRKKKTLQYIPKDKAELKVIMSLCCWTGCRGEDACLMTWDCINFDNNIISFVPNKTKRKTQGKAIALAIHPDLKNALLEAKQWQCNNYICPNLASRYKTNPGGIQQAAIKIFRIVLGVNTNQIGEHRKLPTNIYSLHSFRHTFISWCANNGISQTTVAAIVGHASTAMTDHYTHLSNDSINKAVLNLPSLESHDKDKIISKIISNLQSCDIKTLNEILLIIENKK